MCLRSNFLSQFYSQPAFKILYREQKHCHKREHQQCSLKCFVKFLDNTGGLHKGSAAVSVVLFFTYSSFSIHTGFHNTHYRIPEVQAVIFKSVHTFAQNIWLPGEQIFLHRLNLFDLPLFLEPALLWKMNCYKCSNDSHSCSSIPL